MIQFKISLVEAFILSSFPLNFILVTRAVVSVGGSHCCQSLRLRLTNLEKDNLGLFASTYWCSITGTFKNNIQPL